MMNEAKPSRWLYLTLSGLMLIGLSLRLYSVDWDDGHLAHPDERHITMVAHETRMPENASDMLNPRRSPLNPYWNVRENRPQRFAYGSFPLYLLRLTATGIESLATLTEAVFNPADGSTPSGATATILKVAREWRNANDLTHLSWIGRALSALCDTLTLGLIFLVGRRLYNAYVGLLAAALLTFTVQHIQLSHFYAFDIPTTTIIVAATYFGIRVVQDGRLADSLWLGGLVALAIASKFSALPLLGVLVIAHALRPLLMFWDARAEASSSPTLSYEINRATLGTLVALVCGLIVFAIASPFTLLDFKGYVDSIGEQGEMVRGILDYPYTRQYRNTGLSYWAENYLTWALGWPLGFAALAGFALVVFRIMRRTSVPAELVMLAWVVPYALITLSFQVKFLRYLAPITPFMCVMAAYGLWRLRDWKVGEDDRRLALGSWKPNLQFMVTSLLWLFVLGGTLLYALAFMRIYTEPLSRVQASEWIFRNIPTGKFVTHESWDDSLPYDMLVDGRGRGFREYGVVEMNLHEPDDARKLEQLKGWLQQTDYVILSSNRMYGWIGRLADRFPIVNRYYELLFAEQLGFQLVKEFTARPRLGAWEFNDDRADESFTVYDHPKVSIFRKVRNLSDVEFATLFANLPTAKVNDASGSAATTRDKSLLLDRPVDQLPVIADRAWNPLARASQGLAVGSWWLIVELLGVLALPLAFVLFPHFADGGYAFSKTLGLLLVAYLVWIGASFQLITHHAGIVWLITLALLCFAGWLMFRRRAQMLTLLRARWRLMLIEELLFGVAFLGFVGVRILNPDLWQPWTGGEKFMEFAFLNAILRSPYFPPFDPYFAGGYINYYYYGLYVVGILIKLSGVAPEIAFNLAIPTLFALTAIGAFSVAYNLRIGDGGQRTGDGGQGAADGGQRAEESPRPPTPGPRPLSLYALVSGLLAMMFVVVFGNLDGSVQIIEGLGKASGSDFKSNIIGVEGLVKALQGLPAVVLEGRPLPAFDYWRSSRIVPNTINEFPFWSFLFADLHPHMIGIPFTLLAIALAAHVALQSPLHNSRLTLYSPVMLLTFALTLGAIAVTNTWDAPTYFGLSIGILLLSHYWRYGLQGMRWLGVLIVVPLLAVVSLFLYLPFFNNYKALFVGLGISDIQTDVEPFLKMWGFFLLMGLSFISGELLRRATRQEAPLPRVAQLMARRLMRLPRLLDLQERIADPSALNAMLGGLLALIIGTIVLLALGQYLLAILLWPFALSVLLLLRRAVAPRVAFVNWLAFWVFAILIGVEVVYLKDWLAGGDAKRMNTLFKFYIQVWVLLGVVAGVALPELWRRINAQRGIWPLVWQAATLLLIFASLVFVVWGTAARTVDRFPGARPPTGTLDGLAYMSVGVYTWPDDKSRIEMRYDLEAIQWLNDNVVGTPVVAEANLGYYREGGMRVSSYTGLPSLVGMHQSEQRYSDDVGKRDGEARDFFNTRDSARAMELIRQLRIRYIYIGQLERVTYDPAGLAKFEAMERAGVLDTAYQNQRVKIYRVK